MAEVRYTETIDIRVTPERVFDHRLDFMNLPAVNPNVSGLERTDGGAEPGVGAAYSFDTTIPGMGTIPTTLRVTVAERPDLIANEMEAGLAAREVTTFAPIDGGTRVTFEVAVAVPDDAGDDLSDLVRSSGSAQVRAELENMKRILEA